MSEEIINKVAQSGLVVFDLEDLYPKEEIVSLDIKDQLFHGLILKEKDFRNFIATNDWSVYQGKHVAVFCSTDAIIPVWAFMLVRIALKDIATSCSMGSETELLKTYYTRVFDGIDWKQYQDARMIVKGCSHKPVPESVYIEVTGRLLPFARSLMYGEPCSTVPLYKRK